MTATFTAWHRGGDGPPMVCLHGFADTWRTWELVLPGLERQHDVLALTLPGHAGGLPLDRGAATEAEMLDRIEIAMDDAGFGTAHLVGNSLGGYLALKLAARDRARSVVALAPAGGWARGAASVPELIAHFERMYALAKAAAPYASTILATREGRRQATAFITVNFAHIPPGLLAHQIMGVARCEAAAEMIEVARRDGWALEAELVRCPVRIIWGTADKLLAWPSSAYRFSREWLPNADWVVLDGVGHCPQLDVPVETAQLIAGFTA